MRSTCTPAAVVFAGTALLQLTPSQFALVNVGLVAMVSGWLADARLVTTAGGALLWLGLVLFALAEQARVVVGPERPLPNWPTHRWPRFWPDPTRRGTRSPSAY